MTRAGTALTMLVTMVLAGCGGDVEQRLAGATSSSSAADWTPIAESPLDARSSVGSVWTGSVLLVFGGAVTPVCPEFADCVGPDVDQVRRDGAAYDPASDTWQDIADAPLPLYQTQTTWTGTEAIVTGLTYEPGAYGRRFALGYDPGADRWRQLAAPPGEVYRGVWSGSEVVYGASEDTQRAEPGITGADWALDPAAGSWRRLSEDPFGRSFDRSFTWVGDRFLVTALPILDGKGSQRQPYQLAEYRPDIDTWATLPPSTVGFADPTWWYVNGALVNVAQHVHVATNVDALPPGGQLDLATGVWSAVPQHDPAVQAQEGCRLPAVGPAGHWLIGGGAVLVSLDPPATTFVADCADLAQPEVAAWTGDELLVWGGPDGDHTVNLNLGYRWTPPDPG